MPENEQQIPESIKAELTGFDEEEIKASIKAKVQELLNENREIARQRVENPTPLVGSIVHVMTYPHEEAGHSSMVRPAIVTEVYDGETFISLMVFHMKGIQAWYNVHFSPELKPGHWSWPIK